MAEERPIAFSLMGGKETKIEIEFHGEAPI
jgi:hypothetical protein